MRRLSLPTGLLVLLVCAPAAGAQITAQKPPPLRVSLKTCEKGPNAVDRFAVFKASMPRIRGTRSMQMRFDLSLRRTSKDRFVATKVPKLGRWERSAPGVSGLIVERTVKSLATPAQYRLKVSYRWYGRRGRLLRRASRNSRLCDQPDARPDLAPLKVVQFNQNAQRARYEVTLQNLGKGDASQPFFLRLSLRGVAQPWQTVPFMASGDVVTVTFEAARCGPGGRVEAVVDVQGEIEEASEKNNRFARGCPATLGWR